MSSNLDVSQTLALMYTSVRQDHTIFQHFYISRDKCPGVVLMEQKILTLLLKENRPTAQKVMATFQRGSG